MTLDETADFISEGLETRQRDANLAFLKDVHQALKNGGVWAYPDAMLIFEKTEEGFKLKLDGNNVLVEQ